MEHLRILAIPLLFVLAAASPAADDDPPVPMSGPMPEWMLLHKVEPVYPPLAVRHRIQGTVRFAAVIGKDGRIEELRLVNGHPLLALTAQVAVRQWIYRPTLIGDKPVRIVTQIDVPFRLGPYGAPPPQKRPDQEGQNPTRHRRGCYPGFPMLREMTRRTLLGAATGSIAAAAQAQPLPAFLGITVMPEYIQSEGIDQVLDNIAGRAGATAVATSPYVMTPADEKTGSREPPIDAGAGGVRLLDRPLWGKRELFVSTAPSYTPDLRLYRGLRYQPAAPTDLTRRQGALVREFVLAAKARRLRVYLQIQAAIPPGYRVQFGGPAEEDRPRLPDGRIPPRRVANNGSLASARITNYTQALIRDLCAAYPEIDGIRVDWPEYPPYMLDDVFLDFSPPAEAAAARLGFSFDRMKRDAGAVYELLHGKLTDAHLRRWLEADGSRYTLAGALAARPGVLDLMRFKAALVGELLAGFRRALTQAGGAAKELMPNAFPPPFSWASGLDFASAGRHASGISVKLYTMHWPMMLRFYGDALRQSNPSVSERLLVRTLSRLFDITDDGGSERLAEWRYPEPEEAHPVGLEAQARKIRQARAAAGDTPIYALAHGYGPVTDFRNRLRAAWAASNRRVWINRYGYLSDEKLAAARQIAQAALPASPPNF